MQDFCLEASPPKCWTFAIGTTMRKRMRNFEFTGGVLKAPVQAERVLGAYLRFTPSRFLVRTATGSRRQWTGRRE